MPGAHVNLQLGPDSVEVSVPVVGGQLLEPDGGTGKAKPATAGSKVALGVARADGAPASAPGTPLNLAPMPSVIGLVYGPHDIDVVYASAAAWGALLVCAANGQVTPFITGTHTTDQVVGKCTAPAGVSSATAGRMRCYL